MYRSYGDIKFFDEFDKYPPFPYPDMPEEKKYDWAVSLKSMKWVFIGFPD